MTFFVMTYSGRRLPPYAVGARKFRLAVGDPEKLLTQVIESMLGSGVRAADGQPIDLSIFAMIALPAREDD
jgi:hypothetical protein